MGKVDEVLAEMRQERERLVLELQRVDRVIGALEEASALAADAEERISLVTARGGSTALPPGIGPYTLLDIYEATFAYLATVDTPKNSTEIASALRAGGFKTRSKNLVNTVRVMLRRKTGRATGISVTKDGKRWFVKQRAATGTTQTTPPAAETTSTAS
ncbi:MAG TPA: hypothetical protein VF432_04950 [Thermoanaerobaculia bacterium]